MAQGHDPPSPSWRLVPPAALAGALLGLVGGYLLGRGSAAEPPAVPASVPAGMDEATAAAMEAAREELARWKALADEDPSDPAPPRMVGDLYFEIRFYDRAAPWYERSLEAEDDPDVRNDLGFTLFLAGDVDGAALTLRDLVEAWPDHARGWLALGVVLLHGGGDAVAAGEAFEKAVDLDPDGPVGEEAARFLESMAEVA